LHEAAGAAVWLSVLVITVSFLRAPVADRFSFHFSSEVK
jgi:hypothetical protein